MSAGSRIEIRHATRDDVTLILAFIRELAEYEKLAHDVVATEQGLRETLFPETGRPLAEVLIAEHDARPAAFALFFQNYSTFLAKPGIYLEDLFVRGQFRGKGIGRGLLAHLAELGRERGYGRLEWSVLDWNEPAIRFYESLGAEPMSHWTVYRLTLE